MKSGELKRIYELKNYDYLKLDEIKEPKVFIVPKIVTKNEKAEVKTDTEKLQ